MKVGLALGCGGARSLAHIGVIKVLEQHNIPIDMVAGTSMASLIGGQYALTRDIKYVEKRASEHDWKKMIELCTDFSFFKGFFRGARLKNMINKSVNGSTFLNLKIPFAAIATDIRTGNTVVINEGKLTEAIYASCAIPGVFHPAEINNMTLIDGGVSCPIPVRALKMMGADIVIGIDVIPKHNQCNKSLGMFDVLNYSVTILNYLVSRQELKEADIVISPDCTSVSWQHLFSKDKSADVIKLGEETALKAIPMIKTALSQRDNTLFQFIHAVKSRLPVQNEVNLPSYLQKTV